MYQKLRIWLTKYSVNSVKCSCGQGTYKWLPHGGDGSILVKKIKVVDNLLKHIVVLKYLKMFVLGYLY